MSAQSYYGSSEYSPRAEELFARYVANLETDQGADFEAYCAEHEQYADELIGLHTDWDNVRGLLSKLKELERQGSAQAASLPTAQTPEVPDSTQPAQPLAGVESAGGSTRGAVQALRGAGPVQAPQGRAGGRGWLLLCVTLGAAALTLMLWNRDLQANSEVLALERNQLAASKAETDQRLEQTEAQRKSLLRRSESLNLSLEVAQTQQAQLESAHRELSARESELRGDHDQLDQQHVRLNQAYQELDKSLADLSLKNAAARLAAAQAEQASAHNQAQLEALAQLTRVVALSQHEQATWPSSPEVVEPLAAWLQETGELAQRAQALTQTLGELAQESEAVRELLAELGAWKAPGGLLERSKLRLERLRQIAEDSQGIYAAAWLPLLESLATPQAGSDPLGMELAPQFGLVPLGIDAQTGLWSLEDLLTAAHAPGAGEAAASSLPDQAGESLGKPGTPDLGGVVYWLIRCAQDSDEAHGSFLLALQQPEARHFAAAGLKLEASQTSQESSLALLGLCAPSAAQLECLRASGLEAQRWLGRPVRRLAPQAD